MSGRDDWKSDSEGTAGNRSPIKPAKSKSSFTSAWSPEATLVCELSKLKAKKKKKQRER